LCGNALDFGQLEPEEDEFWRRMYVRAAFACIEGMMYRLKEVAHAAHNSKKCSFSGKELALIKEESFLRFMDNIEFVFSITARAIDSDHRLPVGDNEWDLMRKASKIRNRLTHPKTSSDLIVSVDELHIVGRSFDWLSVQMVELMFGLRQPKSPEIERIYREFKERKQRRGFITRVN
jgi:hypothetical protein